MNGNEVALDSSIAVRVLKADAKAVSALQHFGVLCLPAIVVGELHFGALNSDQVHDNLLSLGKLVQSSRILDVTTSTAAAYADLRLKLKRLGKPIPQNDLWIAAVCLENGLPLATDDAHFGYVDTLTLVRGF
jgi:tRNA(fMet)-specific endonuclease VapC